MQYRFVRHGIDASLLLALGFVLPVVLPISARACKCDGGSLIVHTNDTIDYTWTGDYCDVEFDDPGTCEGAGTRTDLLDRPALIWFILAFDEHTSPGVTVVYFGNDHNLPPDEGWIADHEFCGPAGTLEVPDAGWPEHPATAGNSVAFGSPVVGIYRVPFYWFACWGFEGAYFGTGINPTGGYAAYITDDTPGELIQTDRFGTVRWLDGGDNICPIPPPPSPGACCYADGSCEVIDETDCTGDYQGDDTVCNPNPCPQPGACCFEDGQCEGLIEEACSAAGGEFQGEGIACDPNPCEPIPIQACCFEDGSCEDLLPETCEAEGGFPMGIGLLCSDVECPPVAVEPTTWGLIKARFH